MAPQYQKLYSVAILSVVFAVAYAAIAPSPAKQNAASSESSPKKEEQKWAPVTDSQEFKVNVADGIEGASQVRYEKWDKGTMTGMFSKPIGDGKFEIVNYIADDKGYRVTSVEVVDETQLAGIQAGMATEPNKAHVDISQGGWKYGYTVTPEQIAKEEEQQQD